MNSKQSGMGFLVFYYNNKIIYSLMQIFMNLQRDTSLILLHDNNLHIVFKELDPLCFHKSSHVVSFCATKKIQLFILRILSDNVGHHSYLFCFYAFVALFLFDYHIPYAIPKFYKYFSLNVFSIWSGQKNIHYSSYLI